MQVLNSVIKNKFRIIREFFLEDDPLPDDATHIKSKEKPWKPIVFGEHLDQDEPLLPHLLFSGVVQLKRPHQG